MQWIRLRLFVVKRSFMHAVYDVKRVGNAKFSPHSPARLFLRAAPRRVMVRQLCRPTPFAAELPYGPPVKPTATVHPAHDVASSSSLTDVQIDEAYDELLALVDAELGAVAGIQIGRSRREGPKLVWRNACGDVASKPSRSSSVARAWRCIAHRLFHAAKSAPGSAEFKAARWKLRHYPHRLDQRDATDPESVRQMALLQTWRDAVNSVVLRSRPFTRALADAAMANATSLEAVAATSPWPLGPRSFMKAPRAAFAGNTASRGWQSGGFPTQWRWVSQTLLPWQFRATSLNLVVLTCSLRMCLAGAPR